MRWSRRSGAGCRRSAATTGSCRSCRRRCRRSAARSLSPAMLSSSQRIFDAEKYGSMTRPVRSGDRRGKSLRSPALADRRGAAVLPDDRVVHGLSACAVPQHRRLALVGDADRRDRPRRRPRSPRGRSRPRRARSLPGRARPSRAAGRSGADRGARCDAPYPSHRTGSRGCWWCPGRSPADSPRCSSPPFNV